MKGKSGAAKTREVRTGAGFVFSRDSDRTPHGDPGTTAYVATTDRSEKFGRLPRSGFGRRFKRSGMDWSLRGAEALLPLRTLHMSESLEEFFRYELRKLPQLRCVSCT